MSNDSSSIGIVAIVLLVGVVPLTGAAVAAPASVTMEGPSAATQGETVTIEYQIQNSGANADSYIVNPSLPDGWMVTDHTDDGGTWNPSETKWFWATVGSSETVTASLNVTVPADASGDTILSAVLKNSSGQQGSADHSISVSDTPTETPSSSASISVNAPSQATAGETVTVEYPIQNTGTSPDGYIVNPSVPAGWMITDHTDDGGTWNPSETKWFWATVDSSETVTASLNVTVPADASGDTVLSAVLKNSSGQQGSADDSISVGDTPTETPSSSASVSVNAPSQATASETVTIEYPIQNTGTGANSYIVNTSLPAGWTVTDHTDDGGTWNPSETKWFWATVDSSETVTPSLNVTVPGDAASEMGSIDASVMDSSGMLNSTATVIEVSSSSDDSEDESDSPSVPGGIPDDDGGSEEGEDSETVTETETDDQTETPTATPTATDEPTDTATTTPTATPTATDEPTDTATATPTATDEPTDTATATPTATDTPTEAPSGGGGEQPGTDTTTTSASGPGFGVPVVIAALLTIALLARRQ